ncbi:MAG: proline dehydrogenase [Chloroflexi bacterium]|nr:MAG: proline dehydrogenase [Chloroflexota bacterium]
MPLMRNFFLSLSHSERLRQVASRFGPARAMAHRFVAGETQEEALEAVAVLNRDGLLATLDHLGENVTSEHEARDATTEILELVEGIAAHDLRSGVSLKLTQLGLDLHPALAVENLERIVARAAEVGRFVRIDMESADYVQPTLDLFEGLWSRYKNVGVVIQSYLYRSADDVARLIQMGASVRLVKGAYDEPPEVAFPDKADTDANYVRLMEQLFCDEAQARGVFPAIATHDEHLIAWAKEHTRERQISPERFEFQMLYGIRPGLQRKLVAQGYRVRAYVPYGREWFPYFMRRLAERPANVLFFVRNLFRA